MSEQPLVVGEVEVTSAVRLSPSFVRVELAAPCLAGLGVDGDWLDQRFKIVFPAPGHPLPDLAAAGTGWWDLYCSLPEQQRGSMRTYTVREVRGEAEATRLVVDIVVHDPVDDRDATGPGNRWALGAAPGDRVVVVAPRRGHEFGGREFDPGPDDRLLLVGDETAVPAVAGILRDLPADARGTALLEVPRDEDVQDLPAPAGVEVVWLPRGDTARGERLHAATVARLGLEPGAGTPAVADEEVDPSLWETPRYSSSGEAVPEDPAAPAGELYAWIAGESKVVTGLRRRLVREHGLDRRQVAFMGYWREGVSMRG